MRIIQILPVIAFGDAIGNHAAALDRMFTAGGYQSRIYAEIIDSRLPVKTAKSIKKYKERPDDIILYHMSTDSGLNRKILEYKSPKILNYHNITPAHYFQKYNRQFALGCRQAREDLAYLADHADGCIADSQFNRQELIALGYQCPVKVIPVLIPLQDYKKKLDVHGIRNYVDGYTNILFVGRIVPNKKQEDLIEAFYYYKKYFNQKSRLILVGTNAGIDGYVKDLKWYTHWLGLKDVVFTGQISFPKILAFYQNADVFLCMSEHEGFCVPLIEAMVFRVPVIAYNSTAIADTIGDAGILLEKKNPLETAGMIHYLLTHKELADAIKDNQTQRLNNYRHRKIAGEYLSFLKRFTDTPKAGRPESRGNSSGRYAHVLR